MCKTARLVDLVYPLTPRILLVDLTPRILLTILSSKLRILLILFYYDYALYL